MTNKLITVGCDPEFFVTRDGKIVASQDIIPGTKHEPHWLTGGAIHRDNILGELAMSPASTEDMFVSNLYSVIDQAKQILLEHDADMLWQPSAFVDDSCLQHYEAMEFGCDPDWDCWNYTKPSTPNPLDAGNLRSSGGHAHVGFEYEDREDQFRAAEVWMCILDCLVCYLILTSCVVIFMVSLVGFVLNRMVSSIVHYLTNG